MVYSTIVSEEKTSNSFRLKLKDRFDHVADKLWGKRHKKDKNGKELETWVFKKGEEPVRPNRSGANILRRYKEINKECQKWYAAFLKYRQGKQDTLHLQSA